MIIKVKVIREIVMNPQKIILQYFLFLFLFCFSINFPIKAYPQQNAESNVPKYWYDKGKEALEGVTGFGGAKGQLDFAKKRLNEILTLEDIQNILISEEIRLSDFFTKLEAEHGERADTINTIEDAYFQAAEGLREAMESFKNAVELASDDYTDAYLKLVDTYLMMNNKQGAVDAYEICRESGFKGMTLSLKYLRDITRQIAVVCSKGEVFPSNANHSEGQEELCVKIIGDYMSFAENYLQRNPDEAKALGFVSIEPALIVNKFELAQFYVDTNQLTDARQEYGKIYSQVEADLQKEPDARNKVQELNLQIEQMKRNTVSFTFSFATKDTESLDTMEAFLTLLPAEKTVVGEELAKYYAVSIQEETISIKLANEMVIDNERKEVIRAIPPGEYKGIVTFSQPNIKNETALPFRIILSSQVTDLELRMRKIASKDDKVTVYIHDFTLPSELDYNFRIEPPPPPTPLWRKIALFALLACAMGTSVIAY